ncbi:hypothetical protein LR48_Vigan06g119900 [Vigna angularis]|uniref:Putative plant transposon protein domain-containing protein n=1 Tax=Phaseolus angularis TaxID=3914 RepID=A0A0L9UT13_PHAAN|nr:hypothetical protein LR48_Vigan06g119900 [Vigna angularis]
MSMMEGVDYEDVERTLCVPEGHFQRNRSGAPIHIIRLHLTPLAKYWMAFSHANIQPCSHVSDITVQRAIFLYCVLRGLNINIGQVTADEIQSCARGASSKAPLGHPSLITHLCEAACIDVSRPPLEHLRKELDAAYFTHYCVVDESGHPTPPPQQPRVHRRAPPPAQEPVHEGRAGAIRTLTSAFPERQFISQEDFATRVAWSADPAQECGRAKVAEASAMDEEDEESDDDE